MISLLNMADGVLPQSRPVSLRNFLKEAKAHSARGAVVAIEQRTRAAQEMSVLYRRTGGKFGRLGAVRGGVDGNRPYTQRFQFGVITKPDDDTPPAATSTFEVEAFISIIKCYGTFKNFGRESAFAVVSLINMDPNGAQSNQLVTTMRTNIQDDIGGGTQFAKMTAIGDIPALGSGLLMHVALWRHRDGNADDIRDKIHAALNSAVNQGAQAIATAISGDSATSAGTVGDIADFQVAGIKPIDLLTLGVADLLAGFFSDELIGQHSYWIPPGNVEAFADQAKFAASIRNAPGLGLDPDVQANWPPNTDGDIMYDQGNASYKIWFLLRCREVPGWPVLPNLPGS